MSSCDTEASQSGAEYFSVDETSLCAHSSKDVPTARSGHAMVYLPPLQSYLLYGGTNGRESQDDFYLLDCSSKGAEDLAVEWKKLAVSHARNRKADFLEADGSSVRREYLNAREYHTMHFIDSDLNSEASEGYRVLILGNALVDKKSRGSTFSDEHIRLEQVRVSKCKTKVQWESIKVNSEWKPTARYGHCSVLVGAHIYCFGGSNATSSQYYNDISCYSLAKHEWKRVHTQGLIPSARAFADMALYQSEGNASQEKNSLILYGGYDGKHFFKSMYILDLQLHQWDKVVASGQLPPVSRDHTLTFVPPHHFVLLGGRQRTSLTDDLYLYDAMTKVWRKSQRKRCNLMRRVAHSALLYPTGAPSCTTDPDPMQENCTIFVFGGYADNLTWLNDSLLLHIGFKIFDRERIKGSESKSSASSDNAESCATQEHSSQIEANKVSASPKPTRKRERQCMSRDDERDYIVPSSQQSSSEPSTSRTASFSEADISANKPTLDELQAKIDSLERDKEFLRYQMQKLTEQFVHRIDTVQAKKWKDVQRGIISQVSDITDRSTNEIMNSTNLIEMKLSSMHDLLEVMHHASEEVTQSQERLMVKNSSDEDVDVNATQKSETSGLVALYKARLLSVETENKVLRSKLQLAEEKQRHVEENAMRIKQISQLLLEKRDN